MASLQTALKQYTLTQLFTAAGDWGQKHMKFLRQKQTQRHLFSQEDGGDLQSSGMTGESSFAGEAGKHVLGI